MVLVGGWLVVDRFEGYVPFFFQFVAQFKHFDFNFALAVVFEKALVWLARLVF